MHEYMVYRFKKKNYVVEYNNVLNFKEENLFYYFKNHFKIENSSTIKFNLITCSANENG